MSNKFMGRSLVTLPNVHENILRVDFTAQEQVLYRAVEDRFRELLNEELADGDKLNNMKIMVVQLVRLRQSV